MGFSLDIHVLLVIVLMRWSVLHSRYSCQILAVMCHTVITEACC